MPISYNAETGEAFALGQDGQWAPTRIARNEQTGEAFALDGADWRPLPAAGGPSAAPDALDEVSKAALKTTSPINRGIANVLGLPGSLEHLTGIGLDFLLKNTTGQDLKFREQKTVLPRPEELEKSVGFQYTPAESTAGRYAQAGLQGTTEALATLGAGGLIKGAASAGGMAPAVAETFGAEAAPVAISGASAGVGGKVGHDVSGGNPVYEIAGAFTGAGLGAKAASMIPAGIAKNIPGFGRTVDAAEAANAAGVRLEDLSPTTQAYVVNLLKKGVEPKSAVAQAEAAGLPVSVSLTRGQASGFDPTRRFELNAEQGVFGNEPARYMGGQKAEQVAALRENVQKIKDSQGGGLVDEIGGAGKLIQPKLVAMEAEARKGYQGAYKAAQDLDAEIPVDIARQVAARGRTSIEAFDPLDAPRAYEKLDALDAALANAGTGNISLKELEAHFKRFTVPGMPRDASDAASIAASRGLKDALHEIPAESLPMSSRDLIKAWEDSRTAYREWAKFYKKNPGDIENPVQALTARGKYTGDTTTRVEPADASDYILGSGKNLNASPRHLETLRGFLGVESPEWLALKEESTLRLFSPILDGLGTGSMKPKQVENAVADLFGRHKDAIDVLYSPDEQGVLKQFVRTLNKVTARPEYSTAAQSANAGQVYGKMLLGLLSGVPGVGPVVAGGVKQGYGLARGVFSANTLEKTPQMDQAGRIAAASPSLLDLFNQQEGKK